MGMVDGIDYIGSFDCIIVDEAHVDIFKKVYELYNSKYLIGFTATPTMMKKELVEIDGIECVAEIARRGDQNGILVISFVWYPFIELLQNREWFALQVVFIVNGKCCGGVVTEEK